MKAKVEKIEDVVVVSLSGRIDYESADRFREQCLKNFSREKIIFNLSQLSFVGSSGITPFVEAMSNLTLQSERGVKLCGVSSEFKRVFESSSLRNIEIYDNQEVAKYSFQAYPMNGGEAQTTEVYNIPQDFVEPKVESTED